jgi:hypothetical protein
VSAQGVVGASANPGREFQKQRTEYRTVVGFALPAREVLRFLLAPS